MQFEGAAGDVRKRCRFFPKMVDILSAVQRVREKPPERKYDQVQLAGTTSNHDLTQEEVERNKERMQHITTMLSGKLSMAEAIEAVEKSNYIQEFGTK